MIYNDKYIFVHVPKTGGLSISAALGGKDKKKSTHTPLRCVPTDDRFSFGFIRNPWARMVSLYRFMCQKSFKRTDNFDQEAIRRMGFKSWLMDDEFVMTEDDHPEGEPWVMKTHWRSIPPVGEEASTLDRVHAMQRRPQMWWLEGCSYIGKFETLQTSFDIACDGAGIKRKELPHINKTKGSKWQDEYDQDTYDHIVKYFSPDIEYGDYKFD